MNKCFPSSLDHLLTELKRIELKLHLQVMRTRQENSQTGEDKFRGLYISENEIATIMGALPFQEVCRSSRLHNSALITLAESLKQFEADIVERKQESLRCGLVLRLHELERLFHLSAFDIDAFLVYLLPELDLKY